MLANKHFDQAINVYGISLSIAVFLITWVELKRNCQFRSAKMQNLPFASAQSVT
jgi:hypothetical protein